MTRLAGLMTMAIRFSTTALDGGDGATAKVTEMENLRQDLGTLLFEGGEGVGHGVPPIRPYPYVRIITPKKKTSTYMSRTPLLSVSSDVDGKVAASNRARSLHLPVTFLDGSVIFSLHFRSSFDE